MSVKDVSSEMVTSPGIEESFPPHLSSEPPTRDVYRWTRVSYTCKQVSTVFYTRSGDSDLCTRTKVLGPVSNETKQINKGSPLLEQTSETSLLRRRVSRIPPSLTEGP